MSKLPSLVFSSSQMPLTFIQSFVNLGNIRRVTILGVKQCSGPCDLTAKERVQYLSLWNPYFIRRLCDQIPGNIYLGFEEGKCRGAK